MYKFALQLKNFAVTCLCPILICIYLITFAFFSTNVYSRHIVDIGVFYTEEALKQTNLAQINEILQKRTAIANRALLQAKVPLERRIVAVLPSPVAQKDLTPLNLFLGKSQSYLKFLSDIEHFGMDYVTILVHVRDDMGCGLAQVGGRLAIVIVSDKCNSANKDYLLAHEWGHLDGAAHTQHQHDIAKKRYGVGYVCQGKSTIMNMDTRSDRKQYFYSQADTCGKHNEADVARMIKERMYEPNAIGNFQPPMQIYAHVKLMLKVKVISERHDIHATLSLDRVLEHNTSVELYAKAIDKSSDFKPMIKRIELSKGTKSQQVVIAVEDDNRWEPDDKVSVGLRYPQGLKLTTQEAQVVTIVSDDGP